MNGQMDLNTAMTNVADAIDAVVGEAEPLVVSATPLDQSPGMAEIGEEERYRASSTSTPILNTYAYATLLGWGAFDALRAVSALLRAPKLPVWAPLVNARAGIEAAAQMYWLTEPGITVEARVQRGMAMRLHSARQQQRAPADAAATRAAADKAVDDIRSQASALGWTISGKKQNRVWVGEEAPPPRREAIAMVLRHREPARGTEAGMTWWFYSGVTHAAPYAFTQFISSKEAVPSGIPGMQTAPIYVDGRHLVAATSTLSRAAFTATVSYAHLLGLDTTGLDAAVRSLSETLTGTLRAMDRRSEENPTHG